jgi:hypothetical protein
VIPRFRPSAFVLTPAFDTLDMMGRNRIAAPWVGLICACGPDLVPHAELDEVCGQESPVQILELSAEEPLLGLGWNERLDGRRILAVNYLDESASTDGPRVARHELWSVGMCGESPLLLGTDLRVFRYAEVWPDTLLVCRETAGEVVTIDPHGERQENVVLRTPECRGTVTPHGLVVVQAHDADTGALVLLPWVDDPWTETAVPRVLLEPIRTRAVPSHTFPEDHEVVAVNDDGVFAITPANELVHVSLLDGTITPEAGGVREIEASADGRWVIWQDVVATSEDPDWPPGAIYLRDRMTGTTTHLVDAPLAASHDALSFAEAGVVRLQLGYLYEDPERLWFLPEMASADLPLGMTVERRHDDGRWLVSDHFTGPYWLFDNDLRESRQLFERHGWIEDVDGGLEIVAGETFDVESMRAEGPLWFVSWDGGRQRLAARVNPHYTRLGDGRILTALDVDEDWLGELMVVDPASGDERLVDHHVLAAGPSLDEDDVILYGVSDGDRTGAWLTALAPRDGE